MLISATTSLARLLQVRPAAIEIVESQEHPFWDNLDWTVEAFCHQAGVDTVDMLKRIAHLPIPGPNTHFASEPLYRLLDYLTEDHRHFVEQDLMEIDHLLDVHNVPTYPDGYVLKLVYQSFKAFEEKFRGHMREEEEYVFPWILRLDAVDRTPNLKPNLHRGSVRIFQAAHAHVNEIELQRMMAEINAKIRNHSLLEPTANVTGQVHDQMAHFELRLASHAELESSILFPRAVDLEKRFLDREIDHSLLTFNP